MIYELSLEKLRKKQENVLVGCDSTEKLKPLEGIIGQDRAVKAIKLGLDIKDNGFNIYVSGIPGTGRTTAVKKFLQALAKSKKPPSDWCYVNNFKLFLFLF